MCEYIVNLEDVKITEIESWSKELKVFTWNKDKCEFEAKSVEELRPDLLADTIFELNKLYHNK